ncbi:MAG: deoxyribodipyrimidine photo-lyase, partial [Pseudomonadota bacterium]
GDAAQIIPELMQAIQAKAIFWNRCYEPWRLQRDKSIKANLQARGITAQSFNGSLLWEPWTITKADNTHYQRFTPFYRKGCLASKTPRTPLPAPKPNFAQPDEPANTANWRIQATALHPVNHASWCDQLVSHWQISSQGGKNRLQEFLETGLAGYKQGRNEPSGDHGSRLSPYLHIGQLSPNQLWHAAHIKAEVGDIKEQDLDHFCAELGWREFSYHLLYFHPNLPEQNLQQGFDRFPWHDDAELLKRWQQGQTGIPIIDAGMRELQQSGFMHNRVRMIVASFLTKNLRIHWRYGADWFWDQLVDADLASNSASWQWVAGSGADAAPYFRIFNPVLQSMKFDGQGYYLRRWLPELAALPDKAIHAPWEQPDAVLRQAGITLGVNWPHPIADLGASREAALQAWQSLKSTA